MLRYLSLIFLLPLTLLMLSKQGLAQAPAAKPAAAKSLLDTKIVFAKEGAPKVTFDSHVSSNTDVETNKIQTALVFYAYTMNRADDNTRKALIGQIKSAVSKVATDEGLVRADLLQGNPLLKSFPNGVPVFTIIASQNPGQGTAFEVQPPNGDGAQMAEAAIYLFQELVNKLSESGLRLMTIAMGGMNKWYLELGQASDPASISKAPAYALNLAVDILEKLNGKKVK